MLATGDRVRFRSGGRVMTVVEREIVRKDGSAFCRLVWQDHKGRLQVAIEIPEACLEEASSTGDDMEITREHLKALGIPEDIIAQAEQVGMDLKTLGTLIAEHSKEAATDFLAWLQGKLGGQKL